VLAKSRRIRQSVGADADCTVLDAAAQQGALSPCAGMTGRLIPDRVARAGLKVIEGFAANE